MPAGWLTKLHLGVLIGVSLFTLTGFGCRQTTVKKTASATPLVVWGLWQDSNDMQEAIKAFEAQTGGKIEYKKIASVADYEQTLFKALAEGRGPDVFVIHNTWVENHRRIMAPAPATIIDERGVQEEFVDVVHDDVVRESNVYALPVSVDTMALYYNKDLLAAAGIARAPQTWDEFQQAITRLTHVDQSGTLQQSGAAIGTAANINRASDLVQLLMMQSGLTINDQENGFQIANDQGVRSLTFYTDFANRGKRTYTWDLQQDYSIDAFAEGKTAMLFNYSYQLPVVKQKNPRLNIAIAPMPQLTDTQTKVNFAAYWPFAVSATSQQAEAAWQFVRILTSKDVSLAVNQSEQAPPARRDAVIQLQRDPVIGVFAEQALSAVTWPRSAINASDKIFNDMIDSVVTGSATISDALQRAQDQLKQFQQSQTDAQGT